MVRTKYSDNSKEIINTGIRQALVYQPRCDWDWKQRLEMLNFNSGLSDNNLDKTVVFADD